MTTARIPLRALLFAPVTVLTRHLRLSSKLGLIVTVLLVPLVVLLVTQVRQQSAAVAFTRSELAGLPVAHGLADVVILLHSYRSEQVLSATLPAARATRSAASPSRASSAARIRSA